MSGTRRGQYGSGLVVPVPPTQWDFSQAGELIRATHKNINPDTRLALYDFISEHHMTDPNLYMVKGTVDGPLSFAPEAERYLTSVLLESPHNSVKAAALYELIRGYFNIMQAMRYAALKARTLMEQWQAMGGDAGHGDISRIFGTGTISHQMT